MSYEIVWESRGVVKRYFGDVNGFEVLDSVVEVESDERFRDLRYVINDFLACFGLDVQYSQIEEIAAMDRGAARENPNIKVAMVATRPDFIAAAEDYMNSPLNAYATQVFSTLEDARKWVNLKP